MLVHHTDNAFILTVEDAHKEARKWEAEHAGQFGIVISDGLHFYHVMLRDTADKIIGYIGEDF